MNGDLISKSALIAHIEREYRQWGEDYDVEQILGDIEDFETTYDLNKVLEQLEDASYYYTENCINAVVGLGRAKGIVKAGGIDG